ncbi:MAG: GvpL/GvpF family gas vesicle protein [Nocardioides sp.]|nr:GvpL/GvpF family gas vesicle protein [Nocardioides sp.]
MPETGRYLYAITRHLDPEVLVDIPGLDGGHLDVVEHRGLAVVVSSVDLDEYGEEGLTRNLERLEWLEEVARRHDAVVQALAVKGPTAPLRLATICHDDAGVRRRVDEWHTALQQVLDRVDGRMEWSIKVLTPARKPEPAAAVPAGGEKPRGAEYLRRKKAQAEARLADDEVALHTVEQIHQTLASRTVASRRLPPQDPRLTGHEGTMVLNAAYLVDALDEQAFLSEVQALQAAHPGLVLDHRGPWPPYSFAMLEQG